MIIGDLVFQNSCINTKIFECLVIDLFDHYSGECLQHLHYSTIRRLDGTTHIVGNGLLAVRSVLWFLYILF